MKSLTYKTFSNKYKINYFSSMADKTPVIMWSSYFRAWAITSSSGGPRLPTSHKSNAFFVKIIKEY